MNRPFTIPVLALSFALCADCVAQGRGRRGFRPPPLPVLEALDVDGDGALSDAEIGDAARSLRTLDRDGDGNLTSAELAPDFARSGEPGGGRGGPFGGGPAGPPGMMSMLADHPVMRALDKDGDGELFLDEVTDAARSLDRLDVDFDDQLSAEELQPRRGGGRFGGPGTGGPGMGRPGRGERSYDRVPTPEQLKPEDGAATVPDRATFRELSYQGEEVMIDTHLADLEFVKFQIEGADGDAPQLYFMNTKKWRAHPMFMSATGIGGGGGFGRGSSGTMRGVLVYRPMLASPSGKPGLYTFEFEPNDAYGYDRIRLAYDLLVDKGAEFAGNLAYNLLPRAKQQWATETERYERGQLPVFDPDAVHGDVAYLPLHCAESFGRLRLMTLEQRPGPRDVVVYETLPNEMPRVAGVLTGFKQTPLSHVNLRAVQDDVPNAFVAGVAADARVQALLGKNIYLRVDEQGFELREATQQEVDRHFAALRPKQAQVPPRDLSVREIRAFADIGFADSDSVGVKAANLATLRTFGLGDARTPDGFAVPFSFYHEFMQHNGLYEMARTMLATADFRRDADTRERSLAAFRKTIEKGKLPKWMHAALADVQARFPAGTSIRCRSSTNNEDLPGFSGAGLYDSFTHRPDEGHLGKSIRQVFASMWNFRAFEEREFHRIDHLHAAMGVALHPNQKGEQVNGVAVAKDVLYQAQHRGMTLYYVNAQVGEDLVTNPDAASVPEELLLSSRNPRRDRLMQHSNRVAADGRVLSDAHRDELRACLRTIQQRFAQLYGKRDDAAFAIEVEFKVTAQGELLIKQARPWID